MEKQKRILQMEAEELHDQIEHSQEIIEKLTEVEENLKQSFVKEQKEKEYLQEMLDETGQILYQIKHSEKGLAEEREILLEDLDAELQVRYRSFLMLSTGAEWIKGGRGTKIFYNIFIGGPVLRIMEIDLFS